MRKAVFAALFTAVTMGGAEAAVCVKSNLEKGAWFVARVKFIPGDKTTDLWAGQETCVPDDSAHTVQISVAGIPIPDAPSVSFYSYNRTIADCRIQVWGTTGKMYYNASGGCGPVTGQYFASPGTL